MKDPITYSSYLHFLKQIEPADLSDKLQFPFQLKNSPLAALNRNMTGAYVLDYTRSKYLYANERMSSFVDYPISSIINGGLDFTLGIWHPEDLRLFNEKVFPSNLKFFRDLHTGTHSDYLISCNFRVKNRQNEYITVLQQSIITHLSDSNIPLITLGFITNITPWIKDSRIVHTIEAVSSLSRRTSPLVNHTYFVCEEDGLLTRREIEILKWVCEGFESKQISEKLSLSRHTVNNHRRNIIRKTNSKNFLDLQRYALQTGLI